MEESMKRALLALTICVGMVGATEAAFAGKPAKKAAAEPTFDAGPKHATLGVPVYAGAEEASEKALRGLGLDAFDGYRVGVFFTNGKAADVAVWYVRALQRTVKKEEGDGSLRYTLMISPPSGDNPLGEKVVIDQSDAGVKDETGKKYKTSIAVYRKAAPAPPATQEATPPADAKKAAGAAKGQ
jgi:hypothetical protein